MARHSQPAPRGKEAGFTLIELMVAISILGLIATAITALILMTLRTASETELRVTDANAATITSVFFRQDVEGAASVRVAGTPDCDPAGRPLVVELLGANADSFHDPGETVSYVLADGGTALVRLTCPDSKGAESELVVAEGLTPPQTPEERWVSCEVRRGIPADDCADRTTGLVTLTLPMAGSPRKPTVQHVPIVASREIS